MTNLEINKISGSRIVLIKDLHAECSNHRPTLSPAKGLRKRKAPVVPPGMRGSFESLGSLSVGYGGGGQGWQGNLSGLDMIVGPVVDEVDLGKLALSAVNPEKI